MIGRYGSNTVLAAPITAGGKRLGVLAAYATRATFFMEDDLQLVTLLANLASVILESQAMMQEAAQVRAREEAAQLKDEFLAVAAHDLKTPLTAVVAQAQLLERRARRSPDKPPDLLSLQRLVGESLRLRRLVMEILDMARVEQGRLLGQLELVDLVQIAGEACTHLTSDHLTCAVQSSGPVSGAFDRARVTQLLENLIENAVKYSPNGGQVTVRVSARDQEACIEVQDEGIGIPQADLAHLFERFHRGSNAERSEATGLGLGLYICKGIVEQHGGRIWVSSPGVGAGSTFFVQMPIRPVPAVDLDEVPKTEPDLVGA
jgi:signal transduction histidine kinase